MAGALSHFDAGTQQRGAQYLQQRRVVNLQWDGTSLFALVIGSKRYEVDIVWIEGEWACGCTCPVGSNCKHIYATLRLLLQSAGIQPLAPSAPAPSAPAPSAPTPTPGPRDTPTAMDVAALFANARDTWSRHAILRRLLSLPQFQRVSAYDPLFEEVLAEPDPEVLCWELCRRIAQLNGGSVPVELQPFSERSDLQMLHARRIELQLTNDLLAWAANRKTPSRRSLRFEWGLVRGPRGAMAMSVSPRLTSSRFRDEQRTWEQLRQLLSDVQRNPGSLASDQEQLLAIFLESSGRFGSGYWAHSLTVSAAVATAMLKVVDEPGPLMTWAADSLPEASTRAGIVAGEPLRFAAIPLRILPTPIDHPNGARLELMCLWPDGHQRSIHEVIYFPSTSLPRTPAVVIADGCLYPVSEETPDGIRDRLLEVGGLDVPRESFAEILAPLAHHFPHVRNALAAHTRYVRGKAVVALDLREDDWLQIRVLVYSGDDEWLPHQEPSAEAVVLEFNPVGRWERRVPSSPLSVQEDYDAIASMSAASTDPAETAIVADMTLPIGETWIEEPDPDTVAPALAWLEGSSAEPGTKARPGANAPDEPDRNVGWWMQASARRMAALAELWDSRPTSIRFVGTERVRRLLSGAQVVRPKLKVSASGLDWFAVSAQWEAEGLSLTDGDMAKLRSSTNRFVRLPGGWVRRDAVEAHDETAGVLADLGVEIGGGEQRITLWQLSGARPESVAALEQMGASREAMQALTKLRQQLRAFKGVPEVPVPARIVAELRPYQRQGLDFLAYTSRMGIGAVLADDMGLGKTLQALAWLQHLIKADPKGGPSLVVCPTSVMHNWMREAQQFAPKLKVLLLERGAERHELRKQIGRYDLVITNYALLRLDLDQWRDVALRAAILDEAQNIKNPDAAVSQAACELNAKHRLALTGTPLENRPLDLWSITNFVNPGYLGDRTDFSARFDRLDGPPHSRTLLAAKLRPILLRRLKRDVAADLPERIEERRDCELTPGQRQLYLAELRRSRRIVDDIADDPQELRRNKIIILAALTRLRQICCHPALAHGNPKLGSGKFDALFELLEPLLEEGHKVLVFSQFVQCLKLLEAEMEKRGIAHHKLTGQTTKREQVVRAFQEDKRASVFLISLKAGGTGLNLTAASYVVLFDPWWNPAAEAQAIDRTHRIGQDRTVIAYRMIARGTIEEKIWELQQKKAAMVRDILGEEGFARALDRDALKFLLEDIGE